MLLLLLGNMPMLFGQSLKVDIKSAPSTWALQVASDASDDLPKVEFAPKSALEYLFNRAREGVKSYLRRCFPKNRIFVYFFSLCIVPILALWKWGVIL